VFDHRGTLRPSILALEPQESGNEDGVLRSWYNDAGALKPYVPSDTRSDVQTPASLHQPGASLHTRQSPFERFYRYRRGLSARSAKLTEP